MKKNNYILITIFLVLIIVIGIPFIYYFNHNSNEDLRSDNEIFASEYTKVSEDNVFDYRTGEEIAKILEHGTGIVFLGFPECQWCQQYAMYLNDIARQNGIDKIYYYNIKKDRNKNTKLYQKIVSLLGDNLTYDDEGNKRIYVPDVSFVLNGEVIGHDNESSYDVSGIPEDYWTIDKINNLEKKLRTFMLKIKSSECSSCEA